MGPVKNLEAIEHYLGYPLAVLYGDRRPGIVPQHHEPFVGVVGIDGPWRVGEHEAFAERYRAPHAELGLEAIGESCSEAQGHQRRGPRLELEAPIRAGRNFSHDPVASDAHAAAGQVGTNIVARRASCGTRRWGDGRVDRLENNGGKLERHWPRREMRGARAIVLAGPAPRCSFALFDCTILIHDTNEGNSDCRSFWQPSGTSG